MLGGGQVAVARAGASGRSGATCLLDGKPEGVGVGPEERRQRRVASRSGVGRSSYRPRARGGRRRRTEEQSAGKEEVEDRDANINLEKYKGVTEK